MQVGIQRAGWHYCIAAVSVYHVRHYVRVAPVMYQDKTMFWGVSWRGGTAISSKCNAEANISIDGVTLMKWLNLVENLSLMW